MDTPVDRLLDALRVSGLNPSAEALARMVTYVAEHGMTGKIPINEHLSLLLHPEAIYPERCAGSGHVQSDSVDVHWCSECCRHVDVESVAGFGTGWKLRPHNRPKVDA